VGKEIQGNRIPKEGTIRGLYQRKECVNGQVMVYVLWFFSLFLSFK
jgi:hypothetical protein